MRNKKTAWRKAASDTKKITNWFPTINSDQITSNNTDEFLLDEFSYDEIDGLPYDEVVNSSDNDDNKFTLKSLDALLKKKPDDVRLRTVSQFLHLVKDQWFSKLSASEFLACSIGKELWHAHVICSWTNQ